MSKAILIMDMPENCMVCPMCNGADECIMQNEDKNFAADTFEDMRKNCPLRELPERHNEDAQQVGEQWSVFNRGWNECLHIIENSSPELLQPADNDTTQPGIMPAT